MHYRGAAPALNDLIAGHINMVMMGPSIALPTVQAGKINMLGVRQREARSPQLPDVPTIAETVAGYDASVSFGLFAAAGTPRDDRRQDQRRRSEDHQTIRNSADKSSRAAGGSQPLPGSLGSVRPSIFGEDAAKWAKVISDAKLQIE